MTDETVKQETKSTSTKKEEDVKTPEMTLTQEDMTNITCQTSLVRESIPAVLGKVKSTIARENPGLEGDKYRQAVVADLIGRFKNVSMSNAVSFTGIIIGATNPIDVNRKLREESIEAYSKNPKTAIEQGMIRMDLSEIDGKEHPTVLDSRRTWRTGTVNRGFGEVLEHRWLKNAFMIVKLDGGDIKVGRMTIDGTISKAVLPLNKYCDLYASNRTSEGDIEYLLGTSKSTQFIERADSNIDVVKMVEKYAKDYLVPFIELDKWVQQNEGTFDSVMISKCSILQNTSIEAKEGKPNTSKAILSLQDLDILNSETVDAWVPRIDDIKCDYGIGSEIYVVASRAKRGKKRDAKGNMSEEPGNIQVNVMGIIPIKVVEVQGNDAKSESAPKAPTEKTTSTTETKSSEDFS